MPCRGAVNLCEACVAHQPEQFSGRVAGIDPHRPEPYNETAPDYRAADFFRVAGWVVERRIDDSKGTPPSRAAARSISSATCAGGLARYIKPSMQLYVQ